VKFRNNKLRSDYLNSVLGGHLKANKVGENFYKLLLVAAEYAKLMLVWC
jgi:hypothetical protein